MAEKNYKALEAVQVKSFDMEGFSIRAQFNPARIVSTGAKVDARSLKERKCFLCPENLPVEQERLPFGFRHLVLCNPYPIFPQHFTIPTRKHSPQLILPQWNDFLELTRRLAPFTVFYNGPRSGASVKSNPDTADIPIIFLTALNSTTDIVKGFQAGASDFISKPFNKEELIIRVTHQISLVAAKRIILNKTEELQRIIAVRDRSFPILEYRSWATD